MSMRARKPGAAPGSPEAISGPEAGALPEESPGPDSGSHTDVKQVSQLYVEKRPNDGTPLDEAGQDLGKFSGLDVPGTAVLEEGGSPVIRQERADMTHLEDGGLPEYLSALDWMETALEFNNLLYGDVKTENFGRFRDGMKPVDLVGGDYVRTDPSPGEIENIYDRMVENFSDDYGLDEEFLRAVTETLSSRY